MTFKEYFKETGGANVEELDPRYVNETDHTKAVHDALGIDAGTVGGVEAAALQLRSEKNQANGYPGLDANSKFLVSQIPDTVVGAMDYQGPWDASANIPNIGTATKNKGDYWVVSTAGATALAGEPSTDWEIGDWAVWNGGDFDKIDNSDKVSLVDGQSGIVDLTGSYAGLIHKARHAIGGADVITPAAIGAIPTTTPQFMGDLNTISGTGFHRINRNDGVSTNTPPILTGDHSWFYLTQIEHSIGTFKTQTARDFNGKSEQVRECINSVWTAWSPVPFKSDKAKIDAIDSIPVGVVWEYGGDALPVGGKWQFARGQELSQATYPDLFAMFGNRFGAAAAGMFRLPNHQRKVAVGVFPDNIPPAGSYDMSIVGQLGGVDDHILEAGQVPPVQSHGHPSGGSTGGISLNHTHSYNGAGDLPNVPGGGSRNAANASQGATGTVSSGHTHTDPASAANTPAQDVATAHNNVQPFIAMNFIVKVLP